MNYTLQPSWSDLINSKTWTELYERCGVHPRNRTACKFIQDYVRTKYPNSHLERYRANAGKFQDEEFAELVARCTSVRQIILEGDWKIAGGTYAMIHKRIQRQQLPTDHFLGQGTTKGRVIGPKRPLNDYLTTNSYQITSSKLKSRLWKEGLKTKQCETCGITEWNGQPAPLQLDHINGEHSDNRLENLRILCANCHAQTDTFCGKNRK